VLGPAIGDAFWGLIRTPPEQRDTAAIEASIARTTAAIRILDGELGRTDAADVTIAASFD
jgi:glutathione S-transferase